MAFSSAQVEDDGVLDHTRIFIVTTVSLKEVEKEDIEQKRGVFLVEETF